MMCSRVLLCREDPSEHSMLRFGILRSANAIHIFIQLIPDCLPDFIAGKLPFAADQAVRLMHQAERAHHPLFRDVVSDAGHQHTATKARPTKMPKLPRPTFFCANGA